MQKRDIHHVGDEVRLPERVGQSPYQVRSQSFHWLPYTEILLNHVFQRKRDSGRDSIAQSYENEFYDLYLD